MSFIDHSVTLEDVFRVVEAQRAPLAPETAGYLALEIADGADANGGNIDPKAVLLSEEGSVALVRPRRETVEGDAETSVRNLLRKLLEASGASTPALSVVATRPPGHGLRALVTELEAALIPVNRAAGRRALARLVREVRRVVLGVGRNASVPPRPMPKTLAKTPTPPPVQVTSLPKVEMSAKLEQTDNFGVLLAMNDPSDPMLAPPAPAKKNPPRFSTTRVEGPRAPKTGLALLIVALLVLGGATLAIWKVAPEFFRGKKSVAPAAVPEPTGANH